jgi:hypothetical protein
MFFLDILIACGLFGTAGGLILLGGIVVAGGIVAAIALI